MNDVKKEVRDKAKTAMSHVSQCSGNKDLEKFTGTIVKAQESAKNVPSCVEELAGCIIVDNMCKLIDDPREGTPLMAEVRSLVSKSTESISDPDARELAMKANQSVKGISEAGPFIEQDFKTFAEKAQL